MKRDVVTQTAQGSRSVPHEIPCNFARRFPLYGVEADGLHLRKAGIDLEHALPQKELNRHINEDSAHDTP